MDKGSSSVGHHRYNMVLVVDFFSSIRTLFAVNIWSRNFTFVFLRGIACRIALDFFKYEEHPIPQ